MQPGSFSNLFDFSSSAQYDSNEAMDIGMYSAGNINLLQDSDGWGMDLTQSCSPGNMSDAHLLAIEVLETGHISNKPDDGDSNLTFPVAEQECGKKSYECMRCNKKFSRQNNLIAHIRIHTGEKPYVCDQCGKKFARRSGLSRHHRIHTGEKPLECELCKKCFADSSNLSRHLRLHSGERPFECDHCGKTFSWKSSLLWHLRSHA